MSLRAPNAAGGFPAIAYVLAKARQAGGLLPFLKRLRGKNTCKTCALGMGGLSGGMVDESGHFPAICKKSVQAVAADLAGAIPESFFKRNSLRALSALSSAELESLGRLSFPIVARAGDTHYQRISWEEALDLAARAFRRAPAQRTFFYASGRSSNEAAFLLQLLARSFGTNNVNNCSYYCHQASGVALSKVYGSGTASVVLGDLARTDLAVVIGANPASNHPRLITQLMKLRRRGGQVIVINPLRELGLTRFRVPSDPRSLLFGSEIASLYLQPHVGSDIALLKALLKGVIEEGGLDRTYIEHYTSGFEDLRRELEECSWGELHEACGVDPYQIERAVRMICAARSGILLWAMGLTHHAFGVDNILAVANLALARGWLGRPGCGLLPIRGHSNVQGVGSVGVKPALKRAFAEKLEELYGVPATLPAGLDTYACMEAAQRGEIDAALLLGGNLYGANPDANWAAGALNKIPFLLQVSTKLNTGHLAGRGRETLVLPALTRDEELQPTSQESMFNFVRLSMGGEASPADGMHADAQRERPLENGRGARGEVQILASLAQRILPEGRFDWSEVRNHQSLRESIARVVPGYEAIAKLGAGGKEFQIAGRTFHRPSFSTADQRAHFHPTPLPHWRPKPGRFRLMTLRSEGQFNSVVYEEEDLYRNSAPRNAALMALEDLRRLALQQGQRIRVESAAGGMDAVAWEANLPAGNIAMYYPEANVLVPRKLDPRSHTPAFKSVEVWLRT